MYSRINQKNKHGHDEDDVIATLSEMGIDISKINIKDFDVTFNPAVMLDYDLSRRSRMSSRHSPRFASSVSPRKSGGSRGYSSYISAPTRVTRDKKTTANRKAFSPSANSWGAVLPTFSESLSQPTGKHNTKRKGVVDRLKPTKLQELEKEFPILERPKYKFVPSRHAALVDRGDVELQRKQKRRKMRQNRFLKMYHNALAYEAYTRRLFDTHEDGFGTQDYFTVSDLMKDYTVCSLPPLPRSLRMSSPAKPPPRYCPPLTFLTVDGSLVKVNRQPSSQEDKTSGDGEQKKNKRLHHSKANTLPQIKPSDSKGKPKEVQGSEVSVKSKGQPKKRHSLVPLCMPAEPTPPAQPESASRAKLGERYSFINSNGKSCIWKNYMRDVQPVYSGPRWSTIGSMEKEKECLN